MHVALPTNGTNSLECRFNVAGAWGVEYTNRPFFRQKQQSRGIARFREVGRAMMVLVVWKRIGSGAGEGLDRRATDVKAAIG